MMGMSNEEVLDFNRKVIDDFRANDGVMPEGSMFHGNPTLLLTMIGAKSGRELTSPLTYTEDGDDLIVMASAGGSPKAPAWAFNLRANPEVTVEIPGQTYRANAIETEGDQRQHAYDLMVANLPRFADYQAAVERQIPLFRLVRT
jgi:deazaflavin-dependent oxidoreductase (nitroreductase family)